MTKLPADFLASLEGLPGYDREAFLHAHTEGAAAVSIRLNPDKQLACWFDEGARLAGEDFTGTLPEGLFGGNPFASEPVPWCNYGYALATRPSFVFDPLFHAGAYYVQEASSMFLHYAWSLVCADLQDARVLDLCAAPGGKSTLLAAQKNIGLLLSNELIRTRVPVLYENVVKWGLPKMLVSSQDPVDFQSLPGFFDAMVVDAPCSGSGLFRKDPGAIDHWSKANVSLCSGRQQRILADALPCLKAGGYLFYATCSYSKEEDEEICDWLIGTMNMEPVQLSVPSHWGITASSTEKGGFGYRFYPHLVTGEGFFLAVFKKREGEDAVLAGEFDCGRPGKTDMENLRQWLDEPEGFRFFSMAEVMMAFPESQWDGLSAIASKFRLRKSGLRLGSFAHGKFNPDHELAMSTELSNSVASTELDLEASIRYLRKETLSAPEGSKGWVCLKYRGLPMGFGKALPNRLNNYYPSEWRIRKDG